MPSLALSSSLASGNKNNPHAHLSPSAEDESTGSHRKLRLPWIKMGIGLIRRLSSAALRGGEKESLLKQKKERGKGAL